MHVLLHYPVRTSAGGGSSGRNLSGVIILHLTPVVDEGKDMRAWIYGFHFPLCPWQRHCASSFRLLYCIALCTKEESCDDGCAQCRVILLQCFSLWHCLLELHHHGLVMLQFLSACEQAQVATLCTAS